ncbi:MAG: hypothetical protein NT154_11860, partial [Verrucomicrobia bacterium]|nr:hypothetical protein [Verrucomicrobiota bacterium]
LTHAAKKRVFVNQFYRVEMLRDVDGSCHEFDYLAQRYLIPLRPATAWQSQRPYASQRDLAPFEAHLKQRLQIALLPQMIAHRFAISQQASDKSAADLLELFAPLFKVLSGKRQVLRPHCVSASGLNDVNLYVDGQNRYLVPVTSRTRFLTRGDRDTEPVEVTIALPDARELNWAQAIPIGGQAYTVTIRTNGAKALLRIPSHGAATMLMVGKGEPMTLESSDAARLLAVRDARFPRRENTLPAAAPVPSGTPAKATLSIDGTCFYHPGPFIVQLGDITVGTLAGSSGSFPCTVKDFGKPAVRIIAGDDGVWYLPERIRLALQTTDKSRACAMWMSGEPILSGRSPKEMLLPLRWTQQPAETAAWNGLDTKRGGKWSGAYGSTAAWLAGVSPAMNLTQNGFRLDVRQGTPFTWAATCEDARALTMPGATNQQRTAACWFDPRQASCQITPANNRPFRLTVYLLDYDRAKRSIEATIADSFGEPLETRPVTVKQMAEGAYLTWTVTGTVQVLLRYTGANPAANAVVSAVFID